MTISEVLDIQNPGCVHGEVVVVTAGMSGKIKLYAYDTVTCVVQPGKFDVAGIAVAPLPMAVVHTVGVLSAQAGLPKTPQTDMASCAESMLGGVRFFTYCLTSASVVGPEIPDAELLAWQLPPSASSVQVDPLTAA
jgi:hypothetical protein